MTTHTRHTKKLGHHSLLLVAGLVVGSLLLAGCVSTPTDDPKTPTPTATETVTPTPTPTPTSAGTEAPKDEAEALAAAQAAVAKEQEVVMAVHTSGATDLTPLSTVATGAELGILTQTANVVAAQKWTVTGSLNFEYQSGYASDLTGSDGTTYPFSSVTLTGCQDASKYDVKLPDGTSPQRSPNLRTVNEVTVIRDPNLKTWLVENTVNSGTPC